MKPLTSLGLKKYFSLKLCMTTAQISETNKIGNTRIM